MPNASKVVALEGFGDITITKRRSSRNLRLSIKPDGAVHVSIPVWATYRAGLQFAASKLDWLQSQIPDLTVLQDGQPVGKFHHLALKPARGIRAPRATVTKTTISVRYPEELGAENPTVQAVASAACIRALRAQAEQLLPPRLAQLAEQHSFRYTSVHIKRMRGRWGSCDSKQRIVLNLFLMQLPWECIDYVLLHELTHTQILRHGPPFWSAMEKLVPNLAAVRRQMRTHRPVLQ